MCRGYRDTCRSAGQSGWMSGGHHGHGGRRGHGQCHCETDASGGCSRPSWRGSWGARPTVEEEREFLKDQAEALRRHLGRIERRLTELGQFGA